MSILFNAVIITYIAIQLIITSILYSMLLQVSVSANYGLYKFACQLCRDKNLKEKLVPKRSGIRTVYQCAGCDKCSTQKPDTNTS